MKTLTTPRHIRGLIFLILYIGSIVLSNLFIGWFGIVPVGFGMQAPAAVWVIGVTMTLRDLTQDQLGIPPVFVGIVAGALVSALFSPQLALASGAAFLFSEVSDLLVYTPIRLRGHLYLSVVVSNTVGTVLDTCVFLWLAFGSLSMAGGQIWGKMVGTLFCVLALRLIHGRSPARLPAYKRAQLSQQVG